MAGIFDGVTGPKITVSLGMSGSVVPGSNVLVVGVGPGLGTCVVGGAQWVDVTDDVDLISIRRGRDSEIDTAQPGTCTLVMDNTSGDYDPTNLAGQFVSGGASLITIGVPVRVQAEWPIGTAYSRFYGEIADVAPDFGNDPTVTFTCTDGLEKLGRAQLAGVVAQWDGDTSGTRIGHLADSAGWPSSLRAFDTGYQVLAPTTLGDFALPLMQKVEQTEMGLLYVNGAGVLVFYDRYRTTSATRSTNVQAAFTDTQGASEVEMLSLEGSKSRERVYNDVHITRDPTPSVEGNFEGVGATVEDTPVEQVATDATSTALYGTLSLPGEVGKLCRSDAEALAMAQGLAPRWSTPQFRVREVRVDATTQGQWTVLLPLDLLDRISISRDYGPATYTTQLLIQAFAEEIHADSSGTSWTMTFTTANPLTAPSLFVVGTAQCDSATTAKLGW